MANMKRTEQGFEMNDVKAEAASGEAGRERASIHRASGMRKPGGGRSRKVNMRCWMAAALTLVMIFILSLPSEAESTDVTIMLDGAKLSFDESMGAPFIDKNSRTQVPLNAVATAFGADVQWDGDAQIAVVKKDGVTVEVPIDEKYILKDGVRIENDSTAVILKQRTYLPIAVVLKAFGASVEWENATRTVVIRSDGTSSVPEIPPTSAGSSDEMRAMWISYLEFNEMPKGEAAFKAAVDKMYDGCVNYGMNAVIVQVRADSDAMYPSKYFPWSKFASGTQGKDPGYDPLAYLVKAAHDRNLEFHAWVNPYRVTGYLMPWSGVSADNPAKKWFSDSDTGNNRWVLSHEGFYYYNPSVPEVRQLVTDGVKEIIDNYDVDGIHFDDYFYPTVNNNDQKLWFDKPEYVASASSADITIWRRDNVNKLVKGVYDAVKAKDSSIVFGISPAGNVNNLRSKSTYFTDIDTWMSKDGYVDYIMPQLYWGFERRDSSGKIAPYAYENNLKTWIDLKNKGKVKLYIGLNVDNAGKNVSDNNPTSEWLRYDDILKRKVEAGRDSGSVSGYAFFRYDLFKAGAAQKEVANLVKVLKQ